MNNLNDEFQSILQRYASSRVVEAMNYSFSNGGKRLRPQLLLEVCKGYGVEETRALPFALALEMIHTYSLVHDDLPAMDNDDLRRGKKTCHLAFDEATAILAGDGLLTEAFNVVMHSSESAEKKVAITQILASCSGVNGMILGQMKDMEAENLTLTWEQLKELHECKTGKLFAASCMIATVLAGKEEKLSFWESLGLEIGLAFQIQDDILDLIKSPEEIGKSTSDTDNNKQTSVSILGLEVAQGMTEELFQSIYRKLLQQQEDMSSVSVLIQQIESRSY